MPTSCVVAFIGETPADPATSGTARHPIALFDPRRARRAAEHTTTDPILSEVTL